MVKGGIQVKGAFIVKGAFPVKMVFHGEIYIYSERCLSEYKQGGLSWANFLSKTA